MVSSRSLSLLAGAGALITSFVVLLLASETGGDPVVLALAATIGVVLTILATWSAVRHVYDIPLRALTQTLQQATAGDLDVTARVHGAGPVGTVADALNEMLARVSGHLATMADERARATTALANMADGLVIINADMRVERVNAAASRLLHVPEMGQPGQGTHVNAPASVAPLTRTLAEVVRDHELQQVYLTALKESQPFTSVIRLAPAPPASGWKHWDEPRYVRATGIPLAAFGAFGHPTGRQSGLLVMQDLTDLRRAEAVRREFVGNVSHELRTPIASLKALVETLEEGALDDPPAAREFLNQMHVEVDNLAQLVQELLELSRIESGQATLHPESVPASGLLEEAIRRLERQAERAEIALGVACEDDLPPVWADPALTERVLINLLQNAIKFTPRGGQITLRAAARPGAVVFSVSDTGIGIAPENLPRLFERFYKVDRSRASGGTGLGLAIAKHIVQAHGGQLWADSAGEGRGSTFSFTLPVAPSAPAHQVDEADPADAPAEHAVQEGVRSESVA